jgi:hypothetical protein
MKPASYPLTDEAAQCQDSTDEGVPWGVLLGVGIGLNPQAIAYGGNGTLKQLSLPGLSFEEALERGGREPHAAFPLEAVRWCEWRPHPPFPLEADVWVLGRDVV